MKRAILSGLILTMGGSLWAADIQKDDQVLFVRDEPLLLYGQPAATAKKGEAYTVLTYQPAERRVYVLAKDKTGKNVSLNAPEFAVVVLPGRGEPAFQRGLNDLKLGRSSDALRELAAAVAAEPDAALYGQVKEAVDGVLGAQRGVAQAVATQEKMAQISAVKRRNAERTSTKDLLSPDDKSAAATQANAYRRAAAAIDAAAKTAVDAARATLEHSAAAFDATLRSLADARAYDAALALLGVRDRLLPGRSPEPLGDLAHADLAAWNDLVASAAAATDGAERDLAANRLDAAGHAAAGGLLILPGDRALKALRMRVEMRLAAVRDRLPEIDAAEQAGDYQGALRLVDALLVESVDDPVLIQRKTALETRLTGSKSLSS